METQLEAQIIVPKESEFESINVSSAEKLLEIVEANRTEPLALNLCFNYRDGNQERFLKLLPKAFDLNKTTTALIFSKLKVDTILISEALRAAFRNDSMTSLKFSNYDRNLNLRLWTFMCQGLLERATPFQLTIKSCSWNFVKPIIEASYSNCFSLNIREVFCHGLHVPLKNLFKRNLCYITLTEMGWEQKLCLELSRCVAELPNLTKLSMKYADVATTALKRLHGSLKLILDSGRLNLLEELDLGYTAVGDKLCYMYLRLLSSDLIEHLALEVEGAVSTAVLKNISSTVANTKNLKHFELGRYLKFTPGTEFDNFSLQRKQSRFFRPFQVNPIVT